MLLLCLTILSPNSSYKRPNMFPLLGYKSPTAVNKTLNYFLFYHQSVQFSSVAQSCLTLCDPMDCSMPGLPVHHQLPEFTRTHVESVIPSNHLILCYPLLLPPSIFPRIRVFKSVSSLHQVAKVFITNTLS